MIEPVEQTAQVETPGVVNAMHVIRRRWWLPLLCAGVCAVVALLLVSREAKQYTATASLRFTTNTLPSQVAGVQANEAADPEGNKATNVQLATATPVAELVVKDLKLPISATELLLKVSASNPQNDYIVQVTAEDESPSLAATIANAFAREYVIYSQQQNEAQLLKGEQLINQRIAELPATDVTDRTNLRDLYQKLLLLQAVQTSSAQVVDTATVPNSPASPKLKATVAIAGIAGVLIGIGLTFLFNLLDRRAKSWEELEELYGVSALAGIPPFPKKLRGDLDRESLLEPFRILHHSLAAISPGRRIKVVLVTSAVPGEGKTTVAFGLARAAALSGQKVVLLEADFRRPTLQHLLATRYGATSPVSADNHHLGDILSANGDPLRLLRSPVPGLPNLYVIFAGSTQSHGLHIAGVNNLRQVIETLTPYVDLVVIDSAPLLPVADTRLLLDQTPIDASLVVARTGSATREEARRTRALLDRHQPLSVGLVINSISELSHDSYHYGYGVTPERGRSSETADGAADQGGLSLSRPTLAQSLPLDQGNIVITQNGARDHLQQSSNIYSR